MDSKKEKLEDFKTAISSTVRSLSNSEKIGHVLAAPNAEPLAAIDTLSGVFPHQYHHSNELASPMPSFLFELF